MNAKYWIFSLLFICSWSAVGQTGVVASAGMSIMHTDNPVIIGNGAWNHGWHLGLTTRLGKSWWYGRLGAELHKIALEGSDKIELFTGRPSVFLVKFPIQAGAYLIKKQDFKLRLEAGPQLSWTSYIDDNNLNLGFDNFRDFQAGIQARAGIDLSSFTVDVGREWGLSELYTGTGYKSDFWFVSAGFFF
jgi:hypothetical protein